MTTKLRGEVRDQIAVFECHAEALRHIRRGLELQLDIPSSLQATHYRCDWLASWRRSPTRRPPRRPIGRARKARSFPDFVARNSGMVGGDNSSDGGLPSALARSFWSITVEAGYRLHALPRVSGSLPTS
jgi:hypothetical protein